MIACDVVILLPEKQILDEHNRLLYSRSTPQAFTVLRVKSSQLLKTLFLENLRGVLLDPVDVVRHLRVRSRKPSFAATERNRRDTVLNRCFVDQWASRVSLFKNINAFSHKVSQHSDNHRRMYPKYKNLCSIFLKELYTASINLVLNVRAISETELCNGRQ